MDLSALANHITLASRRVILKPRHKMAINNETVMKKIILALSTSLCIATAVVGYTVAGTNNFDFEKLKGRPNLQQTPLGSTGTWSLEKLLALSQAEGIELWKTLPAVPMKEMNGHYMGLGPGADNVEYQKGYADYMFNEKSVRGYWLGKAFRPLSATTGEGYNRWRFPGGKIQRNLRMATRMGTSLIDGKPCYVLDYGALNPKMTLVDELRKLDDFIYFGAATTDAGNGKRSEPAFFILVGPTDEWVGAEPSKATK